MGALDRLLRYVEVTWIDATGSAAWMSLDDVKHIECVVNVNVGMLVEVTDDAIRLVSGRIDLPEDPHVMHPMVIPRGCVLLIQELATTGPVLRLEELEKEYINE